MKIFRTIWLVGLSIFPFLAFITAINFGREISVFTIHLFFSPFSLFSSFLPVSFLSLLMWPLSMWLLANHRLRLFSFLIMVHEVGVMYYLTSDLPISVGGLGLSYFSPLVVIIMTLYFLFMAAIVFSALFHVKKKGPVIPINTIKPP